MMHEVLDHGYVKLVDTMGSDKRVVDAARVSIEGGVRTGEPSDERDWQLIKYMAENMHTTPFESCVATFCVKAPIFVFRQWHRHRTQTFNEISGRYSSDYYEDYYVPTVERLVEEQIDNRQGSGKIVKIGDAMSVRELIKQNTEIALKAYRVILNKGTSKELARLVMPVNVYSEMYATANLSNWCKFLNLRLESHAQYEIREYAKAIKQILSEKFPVSIKHLVKF